MDIDWLTVVAQIVNFVGLVWLLHRFLYAPIVQAIDDREAALRQRADEARRLQDEARREKDEYETKRAELERTREQYLHDARAEARRTLNDLLAQAEAEAAGARRRLSEQLAAERRELEERLQETIVRQASAASEQLLQTLAGRSVGEGVIDAFADRLEAEKAELKNLRPPVELRTSFEPTDEQKDRLRTLLERATGRDLAERDVAFVHDGSLLLGVELHYGGSMLTWHARHVLASWESEALRQLQRIGPADAAMDSGAGPTSDAAAESEADSALDPAADLAVDSAFDSAADKPADSTVDLAADPTTDSGQGR